MKDGSLSNDDVFTYALTIDDKCRSCVMHRYIERDLRFWDYLPDDSDIGEAIARHIERRCSGCIEGCWVERHDDHFDISIATDE